jgi:nicotinate phosphoribosyltransferase
MFSGRDRLKPALMTDLYQLTMAAGYRLSGMDAEATFELFIRSLPENRSFLVAAGLEQAVEYLLGLAFDDDDLEWLRSLPVFRHVDEAYFRYLREFRFTGDVWAVPEGTPVFANEPLLQVRAPLPQAQVLETFLLSVLHFQTLVASKASRVVLAAGGRGVVDFGTRRAHGPEAGVLAARAAYIAGCEGTSNLWAARAFGIPAVGTAAHSWTQAFATEQEAFQRYSELFPDSTVLLIDTYDTIRGARNAARIGRGLQGVRIDSGDLLAQSRAVRELLDEEGLTETRIIVSGDLNEYRIRDLLEKQAPVDAFGVGTEMVTSMDQPALGAVYKLVERTQGDRKVYCVKLSRDKQTYPGRKQVWRFTDGEGTYLRDEIGDPGERPDASPPPQPLLVPVVERGRLVYEFPLLGEVRRSAFRKRSRLPAPCLRLEAGDPYPVEWSGTLKDRMNRLKAELDQAPPDG